MQMTARQVLQRIRPRFEPLPDLWDRRWLAMWALTTPTWVILGVLLPLGPWLAAVVLLFGLPEFLSVVVWRKNEYPPLTWVVAKSLKNEQWFPLMFGSWGAITAHQLDVGRVGGIAAFTATLGWLTTHFTVSYARDPYPFTDTRADCPPGDETARTRPLAL